MYDENDSLRERLGIDLQEPIDINEFRNKKNARQQEERALNRVLQKEVGWLLTHWDWEAHFTNFLPLSPPGWRGIVVTVRAGGRAGGCQNCGTHISVTAWWIFSLRSSMELYRPVVVHCHGHLPVCLIWACPWAKNLSNLPQIGSRLCGSHILETAGWNYPI